MKIALFDIDSKIPNLALMKLSSYYKSRGCQVKLSKRSELISADLYFASAVFSSDKSQAKIRQLNERYGRRLIIGGTGASLEACLADEVDRSFPDYSLYAHRHYAIGFLTRGCNKRCEFCVVPKKEGRLQSDYASFEDFVPKGQQNVMLLDNNLLASPTAGALLAEAVKRRFKINFSQTLDIQHLTDDLYERLKKVDSVNSRFTRRMFYFSCNTVKQAEWFSRKADMLRGFGKERVTAVVMYGFNTRLSQDFAILKMMKKLGIIPFVQEYEPTLGAPARVPEDYFDMDLDEVAAFRMRTNGRNGEKFLRYVNRRYFERYGRYYLPLLQAIYRYNNKPRLQHFLEHPELLSIDLYKQYA